MGTKIAGRYVIESEIGRGGMGVVYRARDLELGEAVAIKVASGRFEDPAGPARFTQELMLCRQVAHPNVIRVHDICVHDGKKFITMELLIGRSLKELAPTIDLPTGLRILEHICEALGAIHARAIVHRDLKPPNVFVTDGGEVKVMDFGIAKKAGAPESVTVSGFMAGTPGYMSPEQIMSFGSVTAAADLYALGAIAYELVAKTRPFRHTDPAQIIRLQLMTRPAALRSIVPSCPLVLNDLVMALLAPEPADRPTGAFEVKRVLASLG
jgi:serine/threonine-protein kinase